ncbi:unnamed protein product [Rotaria sordida]|uniref:Uncharacterized protein n=1 Tax=Rotaria sordida TaxID=392033 RepID=A0A813WBX3_9BILA|nr:unnamed protein product [Rotaria sordida]CAF3923991.1 unnamed protein product [Rotaria sordida]
MSGFAFEQASSGFVFDNCRCVLPGKVRKTGTTIVAVKYKDAVVIGADSRCTKGNIIFDDNILKIHRLSDNIYTLGAETSADYDFQTCLLESQLELLKLNQDRQVRVATVVGKQSYQDYIGTYIMIVGVYVTGSHIAPVHPHGNIAYLPFIESD